MAGSEGTRERGKDVTLVRHSPPPPPPAAAAPPTAGWVGALGFADFSSHHQSSPSSISSSPSHNRALMQACTHITLYERWDTRRHRSSDFAENLRRNPTNQAPSERCNEIFSLGGWLAGWELLRRKR
ncbi:hypothetical protein RB195_016211 [Necator americanus]|uniref:Uncharacterized protein n=1 Tax=Necator americanus TaxID=51031 RepID=A0ABR1E828_NECAM